MREQDMRYTQVLHIPKPNYVLNDVFMGVLTSITVPVGIANAFFLGIIAAQDWGWHMQPWMHVVLYAGFVFTVLYWVYRALLERKRKRLARYYADRARELGITARVAGIDVYPDDV